MGWPSTRYGYDGLSYLSPTGWDGYRHRSALVRGGSVDQPGIFRPPGNTELRVNLAVVAAVGELLVPAQNRVGHITVGLEDTR